MEWRTRGRRGNQGSSAEPESIKRMSLETDRPAEVVHDGLAGYSCGGPTPDWSSFCWARTSHGIVVHTAAAEAEPVSCWCGHWRRRL